MIFHWEGIILLATEAMMYAFWASVFLTTERKGVIPFALWEMIESDRMWFSVGVYRHASIWCRWTRQTTSFCSALLYLKWWSNFRRRTQSIHQQLYGGYQLSPEEILTCSKIYLHATGFPDPWFRGFAGASYVLPRISRESIPLWLGWESPTFPIQQMRWLVLTTISTETRIAWEIGLWARLWGAILITLIEVGRPVLLMVAPFLGWDPGLWIGKGG